MKRRRLIALVSIFSLLGLGLLAVIAGVIVMRTDIARSFIADRLASAVNGKVHLGRITGNPFSGLTVDTLAIYDKNGELFLSTGRVTADYDVRDLIDTRLYLRQLVVDHPYLHLRQYANGDWNFRRIFKSTSNGAKPARAPARTWGDFVVFDSVRAINGSFVLSLSWSPDDTLRGHVRDSVINRELKRTDHNISKTPDGYARTYAWTHGDVLLPHVRLVDPDSNKFGQSILIASLNADESDPPFRFRNVRGAVRHHGDSAWLNLSHWDLPASTGSATGKVVWGSSLPIRYDVDVRGDSVALNDINWVYPTLPRTGGGKLLLHIGNKRDLRVMEYTLSQLDMRTTGSHVTGAMTFGVGGPILQVTDVNLIANPLDFDFIRTLNGAPFPIDWRGQIYGSVRATGGPLNNFEVDATRGEWHDTHVPGAVSRFSGSGGLNIVNPVFTAFHDFQLDVGSLDLRSIEYLYPAFPPLGGTISGQATLDSIWTDVRFRDADITHHDGPGKPTRLLGNGRITDGKRYITYDVSLIADSLSFETLARSYPSLKLRGMAAGPITIRGQTPNLEVTTRLSGPAGQVAYTGNLDVDSIGGYSAHGHGEFSRINLAQLLTSPHAALSSLNGSYVLNVAGADARTLSGLAALKLTRSKLDSAVLDSSTATVRFANGSATLTDTVRVSSPMGQFKASGSIGLPGGETVDSIHIWIDVDSIGALRPLLESSRSSSRPDSLRGRLSVTGAAIGNLDSLLVTGKIAGENLYVRGIAADRATGDFAISDALRAPHGSVHTTIAHLVAGGLEFDTLRTNFSLTDTTRGTYSVNGTGHFIPNLSLTAGGAWSKIGMTTAVRLDSLALRLADSRWALVQPATLTLDSSSFQIDSLAIRDGRGLVTVAGIVPKHKPINLKIAATHFPVLDLERVIAGRSAPIGGFGDFSMNVGGTQSDLKVDASVALDSISIADVRIGRLMSTAHYENQRAAVTLNISENARQVLEANADSVPVSVRLFGYDTLPGRLHATVSADSADFALVQTVFSGVSNLKGKMSGAMSVDGSWSAPRVTGQFALRNASLSVDTLGIFLDAVSGSATYSRDTLHIEGLRAHSGDTKNSFGTLDGKVAFEKWAPNWFDLNLTMRDFEAYNRSELARVVATTEVDSGPVRLFGSMSRDSLTGYIAVNRGNIFLPDRKIAAKQIKEQALPIPDEIASAANPSLFNRVTENLKTDLRVHIGSDVALTADYANIQLTGDLRIMPITVFSANAAGNAGAFVSRLAPEGTIFADRGTYTIDFVVIKRDLTVQKGGTITFDRNADWNPYLDLTTRYSVHSTGGHPDIPVIVDVKGRLLPSPQLSFRTDAPFPISESDLVSYLVTGQPGFGLAGQSAEYRNLVASVLAPTVSSALSSALRGTLGSRVGLRLESASPDLTSTATSSVLSESATQYLYSTRLTGEIQISDKLFVSLSSGLCQLNQNYQKLSSQTSLLNQLADPLGGSFEYRLTSALRSGSSVQFSADPSTQALLCSPASELNLRGAAPTPRQYSLSFLKYWRW